MIDSRLDALLALNNAHKVETGELTRIELAALLETAFIADVSGDPPQALVITFDQDAPYASPNFLWFKARYPRFVYVDRVIVSREARGQGIARRFYEGVFARAQAAGHSHVGCEVNLDPPNPGSIAFHAALGFVEVGQATLPNGKTVSYQDRPL